MSQRLIPYCAAINLRSEQAAKYDSFELCNRMMERRNGGLVEWRNIQKKRVMPFSMKVKSQKMEFEKNKKIIDT